MIVIKTYKRVCKLTYYNRLKKTQKLLNRVYNLTLSRKFLKNHIKDYENNGYDFMQCKFYCSKKY